MGSRFEIIPTPIEGLKVLKRIPINDRRGYLERLFCEEELSSILNGRHVVQINHTYTAAKGAVRGLHFQYPPHTEMKFVSCIRGEVFDMAVDIRRGSPTFLRWHAVILSPSDYNTFVIPEGFAHGFQTLTDDCELLYLHTASYNKDAEGALNVLDQRLGITWPLPILQISERDSSHPIIGPSFEGIEL